MYLAWLCYLLFVVMHSSGYLVSCVNHTFGLAMLLASACHVISHAIFVHCVSHVFGLAMLSVLAGHVIYQAYLFIATIMYWARLC